MDIDFFFFFFLGGGGYLFYTFFSLYEKGGLKNVSLMEFCQEMKQ